MFKLASFALIATLGAVGAAQACPSVTVGVAGPVAYVPVVYRPYYGGYGHDWHRFHEGYWHDRGHRYWGPGWDRR